MSERERGRILEDGVIAGNVYDKYGTSNPIARRLMTGFQGAVDSLVRRSGATEVHEVGCGEGRLSAHLALLGLQVRGSDFSEQIVEQARREARELGHDIDFQARSVYDLTPSEDGAELVVCCEVLEHLEEPARALATLGRLARPWLLVSVPREPIWRVLNMARGKYLGELGNTPGHLQHWSRRSFLAFLRSEVEVVAVRSPLPWTVALCRRRAESVR